MAFQTGSVQLFTERARLCERRVGSSAIRQAAPRLVRAPELNAGIRLGMIQNAMSFSNANFPTDPEGRTYHVGVKVGDVANRVLSVGCPVRGKKLARYFDQDSELTEISTSRGFTTYTGKFKGVPLSIVVTGMGIPMMDMMIREISYAVQGPLLIARFGTCGTPVNHDIGTIAVASEGAYYVVRNSNGFLGDAKGPHYNFSQIFPADKELSASILHELCSQDAPVVEGTGATADSFYSSQGRTDTNFDDHNNTVVDDIVKHNNRVASLEMETCCLYDLASSSFGKIRACGTHVILAQRRTNAFLPKERLNEIEKNVGRALMRALTAVPLKNTMEGPECVWNH